MHATANTPIHQRHRIQRFRSICHSDGFFDLLTNEALYEKTEALLPEHRERLYPTTETLSMFLAQAMNRLTGGLSVCNTHTGGYYRARQRLPLEMVSELARFLGRQQSPKAWCWQGRNVRRSDGWPFPEPG